MSVQTQCGLIALIGAPNAGKSTFLNRLIGWNLSIVTPKVQTTRRRILGISIHDTAQLLYVDTPGIFLSRPQRRLERAMLEKAWKEAYEADVVVLVVDVLQEPHTAQHIFLTLLQEKRDVIVVMNKIDVLKNPNLHTYDNVIPISQSKTFWISAKTGQGVESFQKAIIQRLPTGPWLYDRDTLTDLSMRTLAAEKTREVLFLRLRQELPYALTVETEAWEEFRNGSVRIFQVVYVERKSHKIILLGRIKALSLAARKELERLMERPVHLKLFVKVQANWMEERERYTEMDLPFDTKKPQPHHTKC